MIVKIVYGKNESGGRMERLTECDGVDVVRKPEGIELSPFRHNGEDLPGISIGQECSPADIYIVESGKTIDHLCV